MSKIKTTRWPTRNPYGDNLLYKCRFVYGMADNIPITASYKVSATKQINSLLDLTTLFGSAPGLTAAAAAFHNYRVSGLKLKITCWPIIAYANTFPICIYCAASPDITFVTPTIGDLPESRWGRYRVVSAAQAGGKPTSLKMYYSVNKVYGPDVVTKNDVDFTGSITSGGVFVTPSKGPSFQFGAFTMCGVNPTTAIDFHLKVEATAYIKFFSKRELTT